MGRKPATKKSGGSDHRARSEALEGLSGYLSKAASRDFDRLVYERVRLGIMSALAVNSTLTFTDLRQLLKTTDGNLSVHAKKTGGRRLHRL